MNATDLRHKQIAVYARFSSQMQRESSIDDQVRRCTVYVEQHGGKVHPELVFADAAVSGASLQRPQFERMIRLIDEKKIDAIVTEDMSRISRDFADSATIFKKLQYLSIPLIGVADGIDTSARHAKMAFTLKSLMSDMYLDDLRDKTLRGLEGRALAGYSTGGLPLGYRSVAETDTYERVIGYRIEIDEANAAIVRRIFAHYLEGRSLHSIACLFNAEHVPPPRAHTRHRRKGWIASSIRSILHNVAYVGDWSFKKKQWVKLPGTNTRRYRKRAEGEIIRRSYPERRIIDQATWDATQERLAAVSATYTKKPDGSAKGRAATGRQNAYILSGLLRCGACHAPMTIMAGTSARYYRCSDEKKRGTCSNHLSLREDTARRRILGAVRERYTSPKRVDELRKQIAACLGEATRRGNAEIDDRRGRLQRVEQKIAGLIHFISDGDHSDYVRKTLLDLEAQAKSEKGAIKALLQTAEKPIELPSPAGLAEHVHRLEVLLESDPVHGREQLAHLFGGELLVQPQPEGHYVAEGRFFWLRLLDLDFGPSTGPGTTKARSPKRAGFPRLLEQADALSSDGCAGPLVDFPDPGRGRRAGPLGALRRAHRRGLQIAPPGLRILQKRCVAITAESSRRRPRIIALRVSAARIDDAADGPCERLADASVFGTGAGSVSTRARPSSPLRGLCRCCNANVRAERSLTTFAASVRWTDRSTPPTNMPDQPAQTPRSGIQILIEWANEQDHWVRAVASEVIAARRELPEKSIDAAYALLLAEKGLSRDAVPNIPPLAAGAVPTENAEDLRLARLSGLSGVNALASGQEIAFNPKLTVLFGENAAGKTGYVRVLKRVASVRSAQPILGNVHGASSPKPHASIDYTLSGAARTLAWNDESGVPPFTRMSVFDSGAVALHVDDDLTYIFTPGELALFLYVHRALDAVKGRLEREKSEAQPKAANPFLHRFPRDPVIYPKIETLGPSTSIPELEALASITPEEKDSLQVIRDRVEALQPRSTDGRLQVATSDRDLYGALRNAAQVVAAFPWETYGAAVTDVRKANELYVAASKTAFAGEDIPVIFSDVWKDFIFAGEAYLRESGAHEHPKKGDPCPYCRQDLTLKAVSLVEKYRGYCNNEPKKALDAATATVKRIAAPLASLPITGLKASCDQRRANFADISAIPPLLAKGVAFLARFQQHHDEVSTGRAVAEGAALRDTAKDLALDAGGAVTAAEGVIADLRKQVDERKREFESESAKLRLLENRLTLQTVLPEVRVYVERAQWAGRAAPLVNRTTAVLRSLTEQSKLASKELLDKDFERLFEAERVALRAPKVQLDFAGRKGQAARKKTLVPDHRLSEILSEGEQKVIALADFLAEAGLHRTTAPVVFDDPVNSLDYKRLQYVVDRIVELSATRQIIVFTHNIWFATEILSRFEKATADCAYYGVSEAGGTTGIIHRGSHPRWDTVKNLSGRINQLIQGAGSATGEAQAALVESAYGEIRSWCEVVVEQEMLAGVTQRYQPNVAMTKLPQIKPEKFVGARDVILPLFEKACRIMTAHSQPLETLAVRPALDELRKDWGAAQQARDAYLK